MSKIIFSKHFDQGYWPGPLGDQQAAVGEQWVGPHGLLGRLETALGLRGPTEPEAVRIASLVPKLQSMEGFWSKSAEVDPFGTAKLLLSWRDYLCSHGWRGEGKAQRLKALADLAAQVVSGVPDRLQHICERLSGHSAEIESISFYEPLESFPILWRKVVDCLAAQGTALNQKNVSPAPAKGDLGGAKSGQFTPVGDGTLQLLRSAGSMSAAHELAAWLSAQKNLEGGVIISPSPTLDFALQRFGLPTTGCSGATADDTILQVLPLVLEMAWHPPDPQKALDLLSLSVSPIPRGIRTRLASALQEWPAVGSGEWDKKLDEGLQAIPEGDRREAVKTRLKVVFDPCLPRGGYPVKEILRRVKTLMDWGRGRLRSAGEDERPSWSAMLKQLDNLGRLVQLCGMESLTIAQLRRVVHDATSEVSLAPLSEAQAGLGVVGSPGSIAGPTKFVIWWNYTRNAAGSLAAPPLSIAERTALAECGILLPDAAGEVLEISGSWRRPMLAATDAFLMVCPYQGDEGQELFTHPAWDEIACFAGDKKYLLAGSNLKACPAKKPRPGLAMPKPVEAWQGPINTFQLRETESASSLQSLCGCSFKYLLQYWCKIGGGGGWSLPSQARLEGLLMHEIIDEVFQSWPMSPDQAAKEAEKLLHARGPMLAANLFSPGRKAALAQTRRTLTGAVKALVEHLSEADLAPTKTEESLQLDIPELGFNLFGRPDMVAQNNVIDFKRSGSKFWLECLGNGSATQLACYGRLLNPQQKDSLWPPAAIFILRDARMISLGRRAFPNVEPADGPSLAETWNGLVALVQARRNQLSEGDIKALGLMEACPDSSCLGPEGLEIAPSCDYCDYGTLCGNAFRG